MAVKVVIKDKEAKEVGSVELREDVFNVVPNIHLLYQVVRAYQLNRRQGTHKAKTRGEVKASGRKIWPQKGLGRARHGDIAAPIFVGGGKAFPPRPRDYRLDIPKKIKRQALMQAISDRIREGNFIVVDSFGIERPKTKDMVAVLKNHGLYGEKVLIVYGEDNRNIYLSARNIAGVEVMRAEDINAYDVLKKRYLMIDRAGLEKLRARLEK